MTCVEVTYISYGEWTCNFLQLPCACTSSHFTCIFTLILVLSIRCKSYTTEPVYGRVQARGRLGRNTRPDRVNLALERSGGEKNFAWQHSAAFVKVVSTCIGSYSPTCLAISIKPQPALSSHIHSSQLIFHANEPVISKHLPNVASGH